MATSHKVQVTVGGYELGFFTDYEIDLDLMTPADAFSFSTAAPDPKLERLTYEVLRLGRECTFLIDGQPVLTGYITQVAAQGDMLTVSGKDKIWRLVKESAPLRRLERLTLQDLATELAEGVFGRVTFSNARNRDLYASAGALRRGAEPPVFDAPDDPRKLPVGATKWSALAEVLRRAELLAWSSGDGRELILGKPMFLQEPAFRFVRALGDGFSTCADLSWTRSIEDRYTAITVVGASRSQRGSSAYGVNLMRQATALDTSDDFTFPLRLRLVEDVRSLEEAELLAAAAMAERTAEAFTVQVSAWQHGQDGRLYAPDTVAEIEDERTGLRELMYITRVTYSGSRTTEQTQLHVVPLGTRLVIA